MEAIGRDEYLKSFPYDNTIESIRAQALTEARDNRKFEIELYWKRAGYFWVFIALAFGAYASLESRPVLAFLTACSGFIFSLAWYFVNRGSKQWQENWELHVDLLEDDISGPLYKTVVQQSKSRFLALNGPYPFSVSKLNQLLSLYVTIVWLSLMGRLLAIQWGFSPQISPRIAVTVMAVLTVVAATLLAYFGRTRGANRASESRLLFQRTRRFAP